MRVFVAAVILVRCQRIFKPVNNKSSSNPEMYPIQAKRPSNVYTRAYASTVRSEARHIRTSVNTQNISEQRHWLFSPYDHTPVRPHVPIYSLG